MGLLSPNSSPKYYLFMYRPDLGEVADILLPYPRSPLYWFLPIHSYWDNRVIACHAPTRRLPALSVLAIPRSYHLLTTAPIVLISIAIVLPPPQSLVKTPSLLPLQGPAERSLLIGVPPPLYSVLLGFSCVKLPNALIIRTRSIIPSFGAPPFWP